MTFTMVRMGRNLLARRSSALSQGDAAIRSLSSGTLKEVMATKVPVMQEEVKQIREKHGSRVLGTCTVAQAYGGMRGLKCMTYETSLLDPIEGIRFRGYTIPDCQELLPKAKGGEEPLPESLFWLLLTGDIPTEAQVNGLRKDLEKRSGVSQLHNYSSALQAMFRSGIKKVDSNRDLRLLIAFLLPIRDAFLLLQLPDNVIRVLDSLPSSLHPMSQLAIGTLALQEESVMAAEYKKGTTKAKYWEHCLDDTLTILARLPEVAARVYCNKFKPGTFSPSDPSLDMAANYAQMMGFKSKEFQDLMRLYLVIHSDHEGGNVSAHTVKLVGSALSDPYLSLSAGLNGLAGPLHGLANQEVLRWLKAAQEMLGGEEPTKENLTKLCWDLLNAGKIIPGYGHAVLRKTDPRYICQRKFALKHLPDDPLFKLVSLLYEVVPAVLTKQGKVANPWPNVDAHSGVLLQHYGVKEEDYYTVMFGVSRAIGALADLIWDRALGLPIERPKSMTTGAIQQLLEVESA